MQRWPSRSRTRSWIRCAPDACHDRLDGLTIRCRAHLEPFGILARQTVQKLSGIYSQPSTLVSGGAGAVRASWAITNATSPSMFPPRSA